MEKFSIFSKIERADNIINRPYDAYNCYNEDDSYPLKLTEEEAIDLSNNSNWNNRTIDTEKVNKFRKLSKKKES